MLPPKRVEFNEGTGTIFNEELSRGSPSCSPSKNSNAVKNTFKADEGFAIFAPSEAAFAALGREEKMFSIFDWNWISYA
mgnify:CR=1 FL=1